MPLSPLSELAVEVGGRSIPLLKLGATAQVAVASAQQRVGTEPAAVFALGSAVLALSWPESATWATRQRPRPWKITEPLLDYGAKVFDELAAGLGLDEAQRYEFAALTMSDVAIGVSTGTSVLGNTISGNTTNITVDATAAATGTFQAV